MTWFNFGAWVVAWLVIGVISGFVADIIDRVRDLRKYGYYTGRSAGWSDIGIAAILWPVLWLYLAGPLCKNLTIQPIVWFNGASQRVALRLTVTDRIAKKLTGEHP